MKPDDITHITRNGIIVALIHLKNAKEDDANIIWWIDEAVNKLKEIMEKLKEKGEN